jgi:Na+-driven multidrug efflux pump
MYEGKTHTLFFRYAVPQMVGLLFNSIYTIVDGVFIGNRLGRDAMAAAAVSVPLIEILISLALAVASGAAVMIAARLGQGKIIAAQKIFNTAIWMIGSTGLLIALAGNLLLRPLAELLGATPDILDEAATYLWYIVTFAPFQLFSFLLGSMVRNDGRPKLAMTAIILGAVSNIVLDYVFMYPLDMGIAGAALATAVGPVFSVLILLPHFILKKGQLYFICCSLQSKDIKQILFYGFPSFIMEFTIGMATFIYNFAIKYFGFGEIGLAAYLVIGYLMLILLTIFLGMAEGLQSVFSYFMAIGAEKKNRDMLRFSTGIFLGAGIISYGLIAFFAGDFFSIFSPNDLELVAFAQSKSTAYFCGFFLAGFNILMISFWQSTASTKGALIISLSRSLLWPSVLMITLPLIFGRETIWICQSLSEAATACTAIMLQLLFNKAKR